MKNKLIGLLAAGIVLPTMAIATANVAIASEVKVKTSNVEAFTRSDGSIYVNSGGTSVRVPSRRTHRYWTPWRSWRFPWRSYTTNRPTCRHSSYQSTSHITKSGKQTMQSSISSNSCR